MEKRFCKKIMSVKLILAALILSASLTCLSARAEEDLKFSGFTLSPMRSNLILTPGEIYTGTINVSNPGSNESSIAYSVDVRPFYVTEDYGEVFENVDNRGLIADWITITSAGEGIVAPNDTAVVEYQVNVPLGAPAGGQYASIVVTSGDIDEVLDFSDGGSDGKAVSGIQEKIAIAHLVYAEVSGDTVRRGEISDISVPGFILSGNIKGYSSVKNTGNVHSKAVYKMQVFPLFSSEEIYTNEEDPNTRVILPDRTLYSEDSWENTPVVGIFNVIYTVEFEGQTAQVSKMVIKCPIWMLFIIVFIVVAIVIWLVTRAKKRKKAE